MPPIALLPTTSNLTLQTTTTTPTDATTATTVNLAPTSPLHILPHILLSLLLIAAYFPPPFRGRAPLFLVLLALLQWQCTTSPWPPNVGDSRALRYGLSCSWIFILPAIERLVMHTPEREFFRVEDDDDDDETKKRKKEHVVRDWSWGKLWWAVRMVSTPRAVGWNFGGRGINSLRAGMRKKRLAGKRGVMRGEFAVGSLVRAAVCYLVWDLIMLVEGRTDIPDGRTWSWEWDGEALGKVAVVEGFMLGTVYCGMRMQFEIAAAVGVGLGINQPEEWPPIFGSIFDCYTTANVWGKFWHQYIRQPCLGFSRYYVKVLHIPQRSSAAYLIHLTNAFVISTFFHVLSVGTVAGGYYPLRNLISDMSIFFMVQPIAGVIEGSVMAFFTRYVWAPCAKDRKDWTRWDEIAEVVVPSVCRLFGYVWVVCWFFVTSWWFVKAYAGVRMQDWKIPYSVMGKLLGVPAE